FSKLIYARNLSLLRSIERSPCNRYTLSIKFQLVENIRTTKMLLRMGIFSAIFMMLACLLLMKRSELPLDSNEESLWGAFFDLFNAIAVLLSILLLMCSQESWRITLCSKFRLYRLLCGVRPTVSSICDYNKESDLYFQQYGNAWQMHSQRYNQPFRMPDK
ncbi:hypothetical protein PENTCL1PPCAC_18116, partial [Pristionchus entomophagus]